MFKTFFPLLITDESKIFIIQYDENNIILNNKIKINKLEVEPTYKDWYGGAFWRREVVYRELLGYKFIIDGIECFSEKLSFISLTKQNVN